jgi:Spy/CpxP family protein refolding chaperone
VSWFRAQLGLSAEQTAKLDSMQKVFQGEQMKLCEQHCAKRFELAELIKKGGAVTPQMETLTREMADIEGRSEKLTINHIFAIGNQLNGEQRAKFFAKVYEQISSSCRMDMGRMALGKQVSSIPPTPDFGAASDAPKLVLTKSD